MVGIIDEQIYFPLGTRIKIGISYGTVMYVGEVSGHAGNWLGIEWDDPQRGKHNGIVDGKRYFHTQHPTAGSFIRPGKVGPCASLENAARERYLGYGSDSLDATLIAEAQANLHASFFEVVGMDKIARKQSKLEELTEVSVEESNVSTAGYLKNYTMLTTLNVSHTLIWNWEIVADMVKQLPSLTNLNLSSNRLILPEDAQLVELQPDFKQLKYINLGSCGLNNWQDVMRIAELWPDIEALCLQDNTLGRLYEVDCTRIFRKLKELDMQCTKIMDFDQVCKLGNLSTLVSLNLMENGIEELRLPDCEAHAKLNMFVSLEQLNLLQNPIWNEAEAFNELDKLPKLKRLNKTPHLKSNFDEMFSKALGSISSLEVLNRALITSGERRGAEYDNWKKYAADWMQASKTPELLREFYKKHRAYANIVRKYGSPAEFVPSSNVKKSNLIKIRIKQQKTGEIWEKRVPRMITVQTLQGLIMKHFQISSAMSPQLSYINDKHPELVVILDNSAKSLDFYSLQEHDTVLVE